MSKRRAIAVLLLILLLCGCSAQTPAETRLPALAPQFSDILVVTERYTEPENPEARLAWRRELVVQQMRAMASVLWSPAQDIVYDFGSGQVKLYADRIYQGMPYSHGSGSGVGFLRFATGQRENGVYVLDDLNGRMDGDIAFAHVSNDCADMVFWAWASVSGSIRFSSTKHMTEQKGCLPVGDYSVPLASYVGSSREIVESYGKEHMLGCYAQMQIADALVRRTQNEQGHAILVTDIHVVYNADGTVSGEKSYACITDQKSTGLTKDTKRFDEKLGADVYVLCGLDTRQSFDSLYKSGYLPITCKELIDPAPLPEETVTMTAQISGPEDLLKGKLESNYRISHVQLTLLDDGGNVVQRAEGFAQERDMYSYKLGNIQPKSAALSSAYRGSVSPQALPAGDYRCVLSCTLSTGRTVTVYDTVISIP